MPITSHGWAHARKLQKTKNARLQPCHVGGSEHHENADAAIQFGRSRSGSASVRPVHVSRLQLQPLLRERIALADRRQLRAARSSTRSHTEHPIARIAVRAQDG